MRDRRQALVYPGAMRIHPFVRCGSAIATALALGCAAAPPVGREPARNGGGPTNGDTATDGEPVPGFVVAWADHTLVVPLDPREAAQRFDHLWILDDQAEPPIVRRVAYGATEFGAPPCPCPEIPDACRAHGTFTDTILPEGDVPRLPGSQCVCVTDAPVPCDIPDYAVDPESVQYDPSCACGESESDYDVAEPVSLVGGAVHLAGEGHEGACAGYNLYYAFSSSEALVRSSAATYPEPDVWSCHPSGGGGPARPARGACVNHAGAWTDDPDAGQDAEGTESCDPCIGADPQATIELVERGSWWRMGWSFMEESLQLEEVRLTREHCPGPADPCGAPDSFPTLTPVIEDPDVRWWVATDGSAALYDSEGSVALSRPGAMEAARLEEGELASALGVRFHGDLRPLLSAYDRSLTGTEGAESLGDAAMSCTGDEGCAAGGLCDGGLCHAGCTDDLSCWREGICGVFCHEATGRCLRWTEGRCDDQHGCGPGESCDATGTCEVWEGTLAPEDVDFVDPRQGRGWGNRCFSHLTAGRLEAAQAACLRALEVVEDGNVEAAILYNLGRVAEAREWLGLAAERYTASLELRENATVRERLEALSEREDARAYE